RRADEPNRDYAARNADVRAKIQRIMASDADSSAERIGERILRAKFLREHDHDFVADILVYDSLSDAHGLGSYPGEEMVDEGKRFRGREVKRPARKCRYIREEDTGLNLPAFHRE